MNGIGGSFKRTADNLVLHCKDVTTRVVIENVRPLCQKIKIMDIDSAEFYLWRLLVSNLNNSSKGHSKGSPDCMAEELSE